MTVQSKRNLAELKEIFPDFESIITTWLQYATTHGHIQDKKQKRCLQKFADIMREIGVLDD